VRFITNDSPTRTPSIKTETDKPEYSKLTKCPTRMPRAIDSMFSSLRCIPVHHKRITIRLKVI